MPDFNWVDARKSCSLKTVFERLKLEIDSDVEDRNSIRPTPVYYSFTVATHANAITVLLNGNAINQKLVIIKLEGGGISVYDANEQHMMFKATLTLSDDGVCRLSVDGKEKDFWQFRKMALEKLFFQSVPREEW